VFIYFIRQDGPFYVLGAILEWEELRQEEKEIDDTEGVLETFCSFF